MDTLSYGFKKPQNPDTGDIWFPALEDDIQQLNDHNHDGVTSAPLATQVVQAPSTSWVASGSSPAYRQQVNVPTGLDYDTADIWVRTTAGAVVYATITRISSTALYLWTADNTANYVVYFR